MKADMIFQYRKGEIEFYRVCITQDERIIPGTVSNHLYAGKALKRVIKNINHDIKERKEI